MRPSDGMSVPLNACFTFLCDSFSLHKQIIHYSHTTPVKGLGNSSTCSEEGRVFTEGFLKAGRSVIFLLAFQKN